MKKVQLTGGRTHNYALVAVILLALSSGCMDSPFGYSVLSPNQHTTVAKAAVQRLKVSSTPELGRFLVDENGMTLYTSQQDEPGKSNCYGGCAVLWPPLTVWGDVIEGDGVYGVIDFFNRSDGSRQVTYNRMPLYRYALDESEGDIKGRGANGLWHGVASADPAIAQAATPSAIQPCSRIEDSEPKNQCVNSLELKKR